MSQTCLFVYHVPPLFKTRVLYLFSIFYEFFINTFSIIESTEFGTASHKQKLVQVSSCLNIKRSFVQIKIQDQKHKVGHTLNKSSGKGDKINFSKLTPQVERKSTP